MTKLLQNKKKIHFIGIGGISMSALAQYCAEVGFSVSGSDLAIPPNIDRLIACGIKIAKGHSEKNIDDVDLCVYTEAIDSNNVEYNYCVANSIPLISREKLLGEITSGFLQSICVSGAHGKTTTCGMIVSALESDGNKPTAFIGGLLEKRGNYISGKRKQVVVEACEYKRSFLTLKPYIAVMLNIDLEHVDYYKQLIDIEKAFNKFARRTVKKGYVVYNGDNIPYYIMNKVDATLISYGFDKNNDYYATSIKHKLGKYSFDVYKQGEYLTHINLELRGRHNIYNALATLVVCDLLGCNRDCVKGIESFTGVQRRWMVVENSFTNIVEDYAHHPSEIKALVQTARQQGYSKIYLAFQPHTYSRTQKLFNDFLSCFDGVNKLFLLPIYPARELPIPNITSKILAESIDEIGITPTKYCSGFEQCAELLKAEATKDDLVLIVGAGNINQLSQILKGL